MEWSDLDQSGLQTSGCTLRASDGVAAVGFGKGDAGQSRVGAVFESLERFWMDSPDHDRECRMMTPRALADQPNLAGDELIARLAAQIPDALLAVRELNGHSGSLFYPEFIVNPTYPGQPTPGDDTDYAPYLRYSSSIGTASGSDATEANLHGLLELVEHDSVSLALLEWFVLERDAVRMLKAADMPHRLRALHQSIEAASGCTVVVADVTTDLGVPTYLAVMDPSDHTGSLSGAGAALSGEYALERALAEIAQVWLLSAKERPKRPPHELSLARWPRLERCRRLDLRDRVTYAECTSLRPDIGGLDDPERELALLHRMLAARDIRAFHRVLTSPDSLIGVTSTVAPGLERFSLVRYGNPVLPSGRGIGHWRAATQKNRPAR